MNARQLKNKYIEFFISKGHKEIPSASLVPENDPTTLFISAGMHPLVPYLLGQPHPLGERLVDVQKCVRTGDIDDVGDTTHHTFFEMLGNWSLGDYFKEDTIKWSYEFLTQILGLNPLHLHVTCFAGDDDAAKDLESFEIWKSVGITQNHIHFLPKKDNWWGPAGATGPCGPDSEMFIDTKPDAGEIDFSLGCKQGRIIEIWNDVFMQFNKDASGKFNLLPKPNVDTGFGIERNTAILSGFSDNYLSPIWQPIINKIEDLSLIKYSDNPVPFRIIADHLRAAVFMMSDGVSPSNKEAGYVLRRLIRRAIRQGKLININNNFCSTIAKAVLDNQDNYAGIYPELDQNKEIILTNLDLEENRFRKSLDKGLNEINKLIERNHKVSGKEGFDLYQNFGFPIELIKEELKKNNLELDDVEFEKYKSEHIKLSQTLSAGKFKSGLADHSEIITKYHTATHLLHQSLRQILGEHVQQSGSNITSDRLRFDITHSDKLSDEQIKLVTDMVNQQINKKMEVTVTSMPFVDAQKSGALAFFGNKYPEIVTVYQMGDFSAEVCTGPHVKNTGDLGKFVIQKQESAGGGKRRIYAILE